MLKKNDLLLYDPPAEVSPVSDKYVIACKRWSGLVVIDVYGKDGKIVYSQFIDKPAARWITYDRQQDRWSEAGINHLPRAWFAYSYWSGRTEGVAYTSAKVQNAAKGLFPGGGCLVTRIARWQNGCREKKNRERFDRQQAEIEKRFAACKPLPEYAEQWIDNVVMRHSRYIYYRRTGKTSMTGYCTHCRKTVSGECKPGNLIGKSGICPECHSAVRFKSPVTAARHIDSSPFLWCDRDPDTDNLILTQYEVRYIYAKGDPREKGKEPLRVQGVTAREIINPLGVSQVWTYGIKYIAGESVLAWSEAPDIGSLRGEICRKNLHEEVDGSEAWKHCILFCAPAFLAQTAGASRLIRESKIRPAIEGMCKVGYRQLLFDLFGGYGELSAIGTYEPVIHKALGITRSSAAAIAKSNAGSAVLRIAKDTERFRHRPIALEECELAKGIGATEFTDTSVFELLEPYEFFRWAKKICASENTKFAALERDYADYLRDLKTLKITFRKKVLLPERFQEAHAQIATQVAEIKNKGVSLKIRAVHDKFADVYEKSGRSFCTFLPSSAGALIAEGKEMHHCVGTYAERVANGQSIIVFIRKSRSPDKCLATAEFDKFGECVQVRGFANSVPDKQTMEFFDKYKKEVKKQIKERRKNERNAERK